jgi:hypothetical protein
MHPKPGAGGSARPREHREHVHQDHADEKGDQPGGFEQDEAPGTRGCCRRRRREATPVAEMITRLSLGRGACRMGSARPGNWSACAEANAWAALRWAMTPRNPAAAEMPAWKPRPRAAAPYGRIPVRVAPATLSFSCRDLWSNQPKFSVGSARSFGRPDTPMCSGRTLAAAEWGLSIRRF